jgi:DNA-binding response OmpR family regulator
VAAQRGGRRRAPKQDVFRDALVTALADGLDVDPGLLTVTVTLDGEPVKLTAQEYKLLSYLMHHKGKVVSRTELIEHIYDQDFDRDSNTIEVFVTRIRKKLGAEVITTIRGLGYSLDDPADQPRA